MTAASTNFHAMPTDEVVGPLREDATGRYDRKQLEAMWVEHAEQYRSVMDRGCQLGGSSLQAYAGATATSSSTAKTLLERRPALLLWLDPSTSAKKRDELARSEPALVAHFKKVIATQVHCELLTRYSSCVRCCPSTVCQLCCDSPRVPLWYEGGPSLRPVPPGLHDPDRPGHYLSPEKALTKYAADNYKIGSADLKAPSEQALAIYEREMGRSVESFPPDKLADAAKEINDCRVSATVLKAHFTKLRYIRLRVLEGRCKAVVTRARNQEVRRQAGLLEGDKAKKRKKAEKEKKSRKKRTKGKAPASWQSTLDDMKSAAAGSETEDDEESAESHDFGDWGDEDWHTILEHEDADEQFKVEAILAHSGTGKARKYQLKWVGHEDPTWEPTVNIDPGMVMKYLSSLPAKAGGTDKAGPSVDVSQTSGATQMGAGAPRDATHRPKKRRIAPIGERLIMSGAEVVASLGLEVVQTSAYHFNCLAFSVMIGTKSIGTSTAAQRAAQAQSNDERRLTHEEVIARLPQEAATTLGGNGEWWCGHNTASLAHIFEVRGFMNESHIHGFTNRLKRTIITVDVRMPATVLSEYVPGYAAARQLSMPEARERAARTSEQPLWLLLSAMHFSALLPCEGHGHHHDDLLNSRQAELPAAAEPSLTPTEAFAAMQKRLSAADASKGAELIKAAKKAQQERDNAEPTAICVDCKRVAPATEEYFLDQGGNGIYCLDEKACTERTNLALGKRRCTNLA